MKLKLGIVFLLLAVGITVAVFNYRRAETGGSSSGQVTQAKALGKKEVFELLKDSEWLGYSGQSQKVDLESIGAGKRVYLHLWASWCAPCLNEIPELLDYAEKNKATTHFVLISLDYTQEELTKFLKSFPEMNKASFTRIWDKENKISKKVNADRLPMTVIVYPESEETKSIKAVVDWKTL